MRRIVPRGRTRAGDTGDEKSRCHLELIALSTLAHSFADSRTSAYTLQRHLLRLHIIF
jgi:hypothetical protein